MRGIIDIRFKPDAASENGRIIGNDVGDHGTVRVHVGSFIGSADNSGKILGSIADLLKIAVNTVDICLQIGIGSIYNLIDDNGLTPGGTDEC